MSHDHHHHHQPVVLTNVSRAFIVGILLNSIFVLVQAGVGLHIKSLSLLSDAGHNFADVASLILSLIAFKLHKVKSNNQYTYGYRKTSIVVALINAIILLVSIVIISYEAIVRLLHPVALSGKTIAWVALVGVLVNGISAIFFLNDKDKDLNIKSAFLHLAADALISLGIVIGGIIIYYTHLYWIDAALSLFIAIIILISTSKLLRDSIRLSLDGVPNNIDIEKIKQIAVQTNGIKSMHHLHVWAISTTENAMTAHIVLSNDITIEVEQQIKQAFKHELQHQNIHHITIETERENNCCNGDNC
jgi:cobalt-zinc-cadmium efflux system protein